MATKQTYRVYRISESLRKAIKTKREKHNVNTKAVLDAAVTETLPKIVKALHSVGLGMTGKVRPTRWQVDGNLLGALRVASKQTSVPASRLLVAAVTILCQRKGAK